MSEAGDSHQVQGFAVQGGFYAIRQLKFEFLPCLPICLEPSCVRLSHIWATKTSLAWTKIAGGDEVKYVMHYVALVTTFFTDGMRSFMNMH